MGGRMTRRTILAALAVGFAAVLTSGAVAGGRSQERPSAGTALRIQEYPVPAGIAAARRGAGP